MRPLNLPTLMRSRIRWKLRCKQFQTQVLHRLRWSALCQPLIYVICSKGAQPVSEIPPILHLDDVGYLWPSRTSFGLHVPTLTLAPAETVLLLGESGLEKSTLLSLICGTIIAHSGTYQLQDKTLRCCRLVNGTGFVRNISGLFFNNLICCRLPAWMITYCCPHGLHRVAAIAWRIWTPKQQSFVAT